MTFLSDSKGPPLEPDWGEGEFLSPEEPYKFEAGQGLVVEHILCLKSSVYSMITEVTLHHVNG